MVDKSLLGGSVRPAQLATGERIGEYIGQLLLMAPLREETIPTVINREKRDSDATFVQLILVNDDGTFVDLGESPVFWSFVRRQLREQTDPEFPFVVGRIEKGRQAYRITEPTPEEMARAESALGLWKIAVESGKVGEDGRVEEEPF